MASCDIVVIIIAMGMYTPANIQKMHPPGIALQVESSTYHNSIRRCEWNSGVWRYCTCTVHTVRTQ